MSAVPREFFTVDLKGLRARLAARAVSMGMTESDVLRSALSQALGEVGAAPSTVPINQVDLADSDPIKLSVRVGRRAAGVLDRNAHGAGISRGAYLTQLLAEAPPVASSADRAIGFAALGASCDALSLLSRDVRHLAQLLRSSTGAAALAYAERLLTLDADVRAHLALAAVALAKLSTARATP
jgi:hypothetical protein